MLHLDQREGSLKNRLTFPFLFIPDEMLLIHRNLFFQLSSLIIYSLLSITVSQKLFALPIKTVILNSQEESIGLALVYIDYIELQETDGTPIGRLGFVNIKGGFKIFVVLDDGQQNLVGSAKNRRLFDNEETLIGHYDWTTFWSYVYSPSGEKLGKAKCIAFRGICAAGIASFLTGLLDN